VAIVAPGCMEQALKFVRTHQQRAWLIGEVVKGTGLARVVS
jgi:hypothetical protein